MDFEEYAQDNMKRAHHMRDWRERFDKLREKGVSQARFCQKHGFDVYQISRYLSGRIGASWERIYAVEEALDAEGV